METRKHIRKVRFREFLGVVGAREHLRYVIISIVLMIFAVDICARSKKSVPEYYVKMLWLFCFTT